ncbi:unnamed protein product [Penicillium olsonii]|nr:unnamed protein product [Penicillium olsonii]
MTFLKYLFLRITALLLRGLVRLQGKITSSPDAVNYIPSRDPQRKIKIHVYQPKHEVKGPVPVLINFHGSGYLIHAHGSDDAFCREVNQRTEYTVLDVSYRLSPENPFPAPIHDAEDVVRWVQEQPTLFDASHIALSGFSAGGNIALVIASTSFPKETFRSLLTFYPATEPCLDPATIAAPQAGGQPVPSLMLRIFRACYVQSDIDLRDPRISPGLADPHSIPRNVLVVTAGYDSLADEGERLGRSLQQDPDRHVVCERMDRCNHAWDKMAQKATREWEMKCEAYNMAVEMSRL